MSDATPDDYEVVTLESARSDAASTVSQWAERATGLSIDSAPPEEIRRALARLQKKMKPKSFARRTVEGAWAHRNKAIFACSVLASRSHPSTILAANLLSWMGGGGGSGGGGSTSVVSLRG